jgi:hypothetical protein
MMPPHLADVAELCLDVHFSRQAEDPFESRRNWRSLLAYQPVAMAAEEETALFVLAGRCAGKFEEIRAPRAANRDAYCRVTATEAKSVQKAAPGPEPEFTFALSAITKHRGSDGGIAVEGIDSTGTATRLVLPATVVGERADGGGISLETMKILRCYHVSVDISREQWPREQGDNYAVILQFFCKKTPKDIVLFAPAGERRLHYPPIRVDSVGSGSGDAFVRIDTIQVYPNRAAYDFLLFIDADAQPFAATAQPGALQ